MDKLNQFRQIVKKIIENHGQYKPSHGQIETISICDSASDNYLLLDTGWDNVGRVHFVVFHLRIIQDKIWIECDGTEQGITEELLQLGVQKEEIVLGFFRPERRKFIDFAVR